MQSFLEKISNFSGLSTKDLTSAAHIAPYTYKMYKVKKRKGGERVIFHPSKQTKTLQYLVTELLISRLPVHDSAFAYRPGIPSPLRKNAEAHSKNDYLLKLDFKDFFPSIKPGDFIQIINNAIKLKAVTLPYKITPQDEVFIASALFVKYPGQNIGLAIGAPSSPSASNAVMLNLDIAFHEIADRYKAVYTRYADDLAFSTPIKGNCSAIFKEVYKTVEECKSPALAIHPNKIHFLSRRDRRPITGLIVGCDSTVSIGNKAKYRTRLLLYRFKTKRTNDEENQYLRGYLAFIRDSDPNFYNALIVKYGITLINTLKQGQAMGLGVDSE